jgi:RNA polymerase sigma-70 factor (ECF subfamily)
MQDTERDRIFGEWLAVHKGILFKVVHAYAFEHGDRQDLFQEVAVQLWRSVDAFRGDSSVPTWMYRSPFEINSCGVSCSSTARRREPA